MLKVVFSGVLMDMRGLRAVTRQPFFSAAPAVSPPMKYFMVRLVSSDNDQVVSTSAKAFMASGTSETPRDAS